MNNRTSLLLLVLLIMGSKVQAQLQYPDPPPYTGTNPSLSEIRGKLVAAGQRNRIPPHLLFGIAYQESGWAQYRTDGYTKYHWEPPDQGTGRRRIGLGIMQITVYPDDPNFVRLCTDIDYNIERSAQLLVSKWNATPVIGDGIGNNGREKLENWYYSIWAYNGFVYDCAGYTYCNDPRSRPRNETYQGKVLDRIAIGFSNQWQTVRLTEPTNAQIGTSGSYPARIPNTPTPVHIDANFDGVIDNTPSPVDIYVDGNLGQSGGDGSAATPFRRMTDAVDAADRTRAVVLHVKPFWYRERIIIRQNIRIIRDGNSGVVRIRP